MKQVTMESIRQRIADLEDIGSVIGNSKLEKFELACLRELVAVTEQVRLLTEQRDAVVAEMKLAFDKPQAYLSWHAIPPTWEDPLPCGEYLDVHDTDGHKNSDGTDCWPVYAKPETPATDAAIAALRAEGVEMLAKAYETTAKDSDDFKFVNHCNIKAEQARDFARQLRESKGEVSNG